MNRIKIIESPRDGMQGLVRFIPTKEKVRYINALLKVGFDTIDFGSFVSPKAIPQMKDTPEVLAKLDLSQTDTKLLAIVGNKRGGDDASKFEQINYLGYPFSISPTFLKRNLNSSIEKSIQNVDELLNIFHKKKKTLVLFISMAFVNLYNDDWHPDLVATWVSTLHDMGVRIIPLSDTIGISTKKKIALLFSTMVPEFTDIEFGFHLHTTIRHWYRKINAAFLNGCSRFDTVINGLGGCPMAENRLVGNLRTSNLLEYFEINYVPLEVDEQAFSHAFEIALDIFP